MAQINRYTTSPLQADGVFVFSVRLCDDETDRDFERFDTEALPKLAELFVGKTGIMDHNWSTQAQIARIFDTAVCRDGAVSYIKAWAYVLRTPENEALIRDIAGGIKKEVSVGCAMGSARCSVCGKPYGECEHEKGTRVGQEVCTVVLAEPIDAYEFSFVAVPAQRKAGVIKQKKGGEAMTLKQMAQQAGGEAQAEYAALDRLAELGKVYAQTLRKDLVRLGLVLGLDADRQMLARAAEKLDAEELRAMHKALSERAQARFGLRAQLPTDSEAKTDRLENEYMI